MEELFKLCGGSLEDIDERIKLKDNAQIWLNFDDSGRNKGKLVS